MDVEVVKPELAHETRNEDSNAFLPENDNGKTDQEPIKFGSHGTDETTKVENKVVPENNFPKDAVDEWPAPKQVHSFYFVKYRSYDDQKLKAKLDFADKELQKKNQARFQITEKLKAIRADRSNVIAQLKSLGAETKQFRSMMDEKRKEMQPLQQALGKLRGERNNMGRERGVSLCSSEQELNDVIKSLHYHIQHESIPLSEEKQILREIKQLEGTREKVIANAAMRAQIQDSMGEKDAIQEQVKLMGVDLDGVKKEQQVVKAKLKQLEDEKDAIDKQINALQEELALVSEKRDKTFENIQELRKQRDEGNTCFYQNRGVLNKARELAAKKDIEGVRLFCDSEADKFISQWGSSKAFRDDYEKRILQSLDSRLLSKDGRMRNPDEKPLISREEVIPSEPEIVPKPNTKKPKEDTIVSHPNTPSTEKTPKDKTSNKHEKETKKQPSERIVERAELEEEVIEKPKKEISKVNEVDEAKLKAVKREEEMEKAKLALERKKKLAEKAAAKAAIKAQKEAEKKLKEREKKAKKKAGATPAPETEEQSEEAAEPEKAEEAMEAPPPQPAALAKNKADRKETTTRSRNRGKAPDSLQKIILKRKKSTNYWIWAVPAAFSLLILTAVVYYYAV